MPNRLTPLDFQTAAVEQQTGTFTTRWEMLLRALFGDVASVSSLPAVVNRFAFAAQPSLGASDEGYIAFETTYGHLLRWTGTVWEFAPGDPGNGYFEDFAIVPQGAGWKLCDGTATDYLVVGAAALTVTAITPPNLSASYRKGGAAYTGALIAKAGSTAAGATTPGTIPAGTFTGGPSNVINICQDNIVFQAANNAHAHQLPDLTVPALTVPALGVGTIEMAHVAVLPYFRR